MQTVVLVGAVLTSGLMAGLFFSYAISVMPALAGADDRTFVETMQRINAAIINGWFLAVLGGAVLFGVAAAVAQLVADERRLLPWTVAGVALYVAVLAVTGAVNVPLNNLLATADLSDATGDPATVRARFERRWVRWNVVRTVLSVVSFGCLSVALALDTVAAVATS